MSESRSEVTYGYKINAYQWRDTLKVVSMYIFILAAWLGISAMYQNFGSRFIIPAVSAMWFMGAVTTFMIPEDRESTVDKTKWTILGYLGFLFMYRGVIQLIAPISAEQMGAALNITVPAVSGTAVVGLLQNILLMVSVMTPIGFLVYCGQKFVVLRGKMTKRQAFETIKGVRPNQRRF